MRKFAAKLIKKTDRRLHRSIGAGIISVPGGIGTEKIKNMRLFGNYSMNSDTSIAGVGDPDIDGGYKITLKMHGRNMMSGEELALAHEAAGVCSAQSTSQDIYTFTPRTYDNGTVILDGRHIKFKNDICYTVCGIANIASSSYAKKSIGLAFKYSDGSTERIEATALGTAIKFIHCSKAGKSITSIIAYADDTAQIKLTLSAFGIFEGQYSSYDEAFSAYDGETSVLTLSAPLGKVDFMKDYIDLEKGKVTRLTESIKIGGSAEILKTDVSGIFKIKLPSAIARDSTVKGVYRLISREAMLAGSYGFALCEDENYLYLRFIGSVTETDDAISKLNSSPIYISYVRAMKEVEDIAVTLSEKNTHTTLEVLTSITPSMLFAEYYND